ncbi:hypothetical protein A9C19_10630 [Bacillus weihaiensis]|uniref:Uncharacterized protein n=1 Tax=Bacillus weihaiensis TaxID=1547283 RepID=A0A1L3MS53_9BACI|nr:hypothetical protein A9C19_10630 [Bacillus weihaiensis]
MLRGSSFLLGKKHFIFPRKKQMDATQWNDFVLSISFIKKVTLGPKMMLCLSESFISYAVAP